MEQQLFQNFITVGTQVLELFILIALGFLCGKTKMLNDTAVKSITDIVLYIVCPILFHLLLFISSLILFANSRLAW